MSGNKREWGNGPEVPADSSGSGIVRRAPVDEEDLSREGDLFPLFLMVWVASLVRVVGGFLRAETFGTEPTLALMLVLGMPWLLKDALKSYGRWLSRKMTR